MLLVYACTSDLISNTSFIFIVNIAEKLRLKHSQFILYNTSNAIIIIFPIQIKLTVIITPKGYNIGTWFI